MISKYNIKFLFFIQFLTIYAATSIISNALYSISMGCLALCMIMMCWKKGIKSVIWPDKLFCWMYLPFFALIILASVLAGHYDSFLKALDFTSWSIIPFFLYYVTMQRQFSGTSIILGIIAGSWTLGGYALYQWMVLSETVRIQSYLGHPNFLAEMIEMNIPFLLVYAVAGQKNKKIKIAAGVTAIMTCFVLALTASRGALLGLGIGGIIYCIIRFGSLSRMDKKKIMGMALAICLVLGITAGTFFIKYNGNKGAVRSYDYERVLLWKSSYAMWQDHKLVGIGLRHWHDEYINHYILPDAKEKELTQPHNIYAYWFSQTGVVGGTGFILFTIGIFVYLCKKLRANPNDIFLNALFWAFLTVMFHGLVNNGVIDKFVMRLYSTYLGIGLASVAYHRLQTDNHNLTAPERKDDSYENN